MVQPAGIAEFVPHAVHRLGEVLGAGQERVNAPRFVKLFAGFRRMPPNNVTNLGSVRSSGMVPLAVILLTDGVETPAARFVKLFAGFRRMPPNNVTNLGWVRRSPMVTLATIRSILITDRDRPHLLRDSARIRADSEDQLSDAAEHERYDRVGSLIFRRFSHCQTGSLNRRVQPRAAPPGTATM